MKYLRKAAMIWEDFTTGKKKDDSSDGTNKKNVVKKTKSINLKTKATENTQLKPKPVVQKANSAAVSHSNSIKKKYKKTVVSIEDEKAEPKRIIITAKTKSNQEALSSKNMNNGEDKRKFVKIYFDIVSAIGVPNTGKNTQLKILNYEP